MKKLNRPVLAEGEKTGHCHLLLDKNVDVYIIDNIRQFNLTKNTKLTHQEHDTIILDKDMNTSGIVQEYDHFAEEARDVLD